MTKITSSKKLISLMLVVLLLITVMLTGCGGKMETKKQNTDDKGQTTDTQTSGDTDQQKTELEHVEIVWYVVNTPQRDTQLVVDEVNRLIKERTDLNLTLKYQEIDWGAYNDKMNVMLTSGEQVDLCFTSSWTNNFTANVTRGAFLPLNDLLNEYGQDILAHIDAKYLLGTTVKGKIYAIPNYQGYAQPKGLTFKKELVDKYNFDYLSVKSLADVEPYLETIKQNEPGIIPFMPIPNTLFDFYNTKYDQIAEYLLYDSETGKVMSQWEAPEYMEALKLMRKWYEKGYLAKDAATRSDVKSEALSGKYAVMVVSQYYNDGIKSSKDWQYPCCDVPVAYKPFLATNDFQVACVAITKNSRNPERAMMLLNLLYKDKYIYNTLGFGIEGKHWEFVDEEKTTIKTIDNAGYGASSAICWELGSAFNKYYTLEEGKDFMDPQEEYNQKTPPSPILGFVFDGEPVKNELAQVDAINAEYKDILNTGSIADVEGTVKKILERQRNAGLDKIIAEAQAQIEQWKKDNGK